MKIPPLRSAVLVKWFDSVDAPGWQYVLPGEKLNVGLRPAMETRGILISEDALSIAVATTIAPRGADDLKEGFLDVLTIPKGCITSIRVIP